MKYPINYKHEAPMELDFMTLPFGIVENQASFIVIISLRDEKHAFFQKMRFNAFARFDKLQLPRLFIFIVTLIISIKDH